ncbi:hypothetical protein, partial [Actinobacillus pleuropneumoniae]
FHNNGLLNHTTKSSPINLVSNAYKENHSAERKDSNTKKETLGSQVGPNPESYGSSKNSELISNLTASH